MSSTTQLGRAVRAVAGRAARHPKTAIALWLVLVAGLVAGGMATTTKELTDATNGVGQSGAADRALADAGLREQPVEAVLVTAGSPEAARAAAADVQRRLDATPDVARTAGPAQDAQLATAGGRELLVRATLRADPDDSADAVDAVARAVADAQRAHPGAGFAQAGPGSFDQAIGDVVGEDLGKAEMISLPLTLGILVLAFGAFVAALLPLVLGLTATAGALGALPLLSHLAPMDETAATVVVLIGLAVGVDYSLFAVRRMREELAAGRDRDAAIAVTAATVGRAVVVAGATVVLALGGLLLTGIGTFVSMGLGTILVVLLAVLGATTALPAMLALTAGRLARRAQRPARRDVWGAIARRVTRRPAVALTLAVAALAVPALAATTMQTGSEGLESLPADVPAVQAQLAVERSFPGTPEPARVVVEGRGLQDRTAQLRELGRRAAEATGARGEVGVRVARDGRTAVVEVPMPGGDAAGRAVRDVRAEVLPDAGAVVPGAREARLTGGAAQSADFTDRLREVTPVVLGLVLALAFVLLIVTFRSPWLAAGVIVLDLLSVGATYGVLVAVFQEGWGADALGLDATGTITDWVPLFAFVILFGLSMDYTVLVLERVREARASGMGAREAAAHGISRTAGAVTSAAVVMVAVFSVFATLRLVSMQQFGVGMAAAVLLDATIVRAVALPALVALLGERRWRVRWDAPRRARGLSAAAARGR